MNTFELIIYSIIALALILVFLTFAPQFLEQKQSISEMEKAIQIAKSPSMLGKTLNLEFPLYTKDFIVTKNSFGEKNTLIAFECLEGQECCIKKSDQSEGYNCDKTIDWDYDYFETNQLKKIQTSVRCTVQEDLFTCRFYFTKLPAQAKIDAIEVIDTSKGVGEIKILVKNTGGAQLAFGSTTLKLEKKAGEKWIETDYVSEAKETQSIMPKENETLYWSISPKTSGEYKAIFTFEGQNAGFDESFTTFTLDTTKNCKTGETIETIFDPEKNTYQEIHSCENCQNAFDCANAWSKQETKTFNPMNNTRAYCTKQNYQGNC